MDSKILASLVIIGGTIIELGLLWNLNLFSNLYIRYLAGIIIILDILALLRILLEII